MSANLKYVKHFSTGSITWFNLTNINDDFIIKQTIDRVDRVIVIRKSYYYNLICGFSSPSNVRENRWYRRVTFHFFLISL